jgi:biopolymer transport protein ExbD
MFSCYCFFLNHINIGQSKCDQDDVAKAQSNEKQTSNTLVYPSQSKIYIDKQPVSFEELETTLMLQDGFIKGPNCYCSYSVQFYKQ